MRARLALSYALGKHSLELREVVLKDKPQALRALSPKATVPVLQLKNGDVIDESLDIMKWALSINDKSDWFLAEHQEEVDALINLNDGDFKWALDHYKYADRHEHSEEHYRKLGETFLKKLELRLQRTPFLMGGHISLADAAIFPFVRQFAHVNKNWFLNSEYSALITWLNFFLESDLFIGIMKKYPKWAPEDEIVLFPGQ